MDKAVIDYHKIAEAVDYYVGLGYKYIEVPWIVQKEYIDITKPKNSNSIDTFLGSLVGSGEQSFLSIKDRLLNEKYVCVTPCFRDENPVTELHRNYFMKVELIHIKPKYPVTHCFSMLIDAFGFFSRYGKVYMKETKEGFDLKINGVEVGSYGIRETQKDYSYLIGVDFGAEFGGGSTLIEDYRMEFDWVYGTGCAEPRLSQAIGS